MFITFKFGDVTQEFDVWRVPCSTQKKWLRILTTDGATCVVYNDAYRSHSSRINMLHAWRFTPKRNNVIIYKTNGHY